MRFEKYFNNSRVDWRCRIGEKKFESTFAIQVKFHEWNVRYFLILINLCESLSKFSNSIFVMHTSNTFKWSANESVRVCFVSVCHGQITSHVYLVGSLLYCYKHVLLLGANQIISIISQKNSMITFTDY